MSPQPQREADEDPRADLRWGTVPRLVADVARRLDGTEAVVDGERRLTYGELAADVTRCTRALMAAGCEPGERIALWAPNCAEWVVGALGALGAGAVLVPLNTRFKGEEAAYIVRTCGARLLLTVQGFLGLDFPGALAREDVGDLREIVVLRDDGCAGSGPAATLERFLERGRVVDPERAAERAASVRPDDVSDLIFTSGTTGRPKGAMLTHAQSLRTFGTWASIVGLCEHDRYLVVNPFFHTFGYKAGLLACLMAGATVVPEAVFDAGRVLRRIADERITVLPGPPTIYRSLLAHPERPSADLSTLRLGVTGAAAVPVELVAAMRHELGFETVLTAYGLTESCGTVTMCRRGDDDGVVATTSGRAIPGIEVEIVDPDGQPLPSGRSGEIVVRGYTVMSGYWGDPSSTASAVDDDGWLHTGDVGVMDAERNVRITDRLTDMFVVGGFNAYPAEIEATLRRHGGVADAAVIGVPDERLGEIGCAYVVPGAGLTDGRHADGRPADGAVAGDVSAGGALAGDVLAWSRRVLANYKAPRYVVLVDRLPVNAGGKVLKRELRDRFVAGTDEIATYERST